MTESNERNHDDVTQGENPGAQGDIGAGQGNSGDDPVSEDTGADDTGADDPGADDPVADDIASRNPRTADISAGEQVLDEGRVAPEPDDFTNGGTVDESSRETSHDRKHAADERSDAGAPPEQGEPAA